MCSLRRRFAGGAQDSVESAASDKSEERRALVLVLGGFVVPTTLEYPFFGGIGLEHSFEKRGTRF